MDQKKLKLVLCAGQRCCPVLEQVDDKTFQLSDDFGGKVILEKEQIALLKEMLNEHFE